MSQISYDYRRDAYALQNLPQRSILLADKPRY